MKFYIAKFVAWSLGPTRAAAGAAARIIANKERRR